MWCVNFKKISEISTANFEKFLFERIEWNDLRAFQDKSGIHCKRSSLFLKRKFSQQKGKLQVCYVGVRKPINQARRKINSNFVRKMNFVYLLLQISRKEK